MKEEKFSSGHTVLGNITGVSDGQKEVLARTIRKL
jgi:hypothetical protein